MSIVVRSIVADKLKTIKKNFAKVKEVYISHGSTYQSMSRKSEISKYTLRRDKKNVNFDPISQLFHPYYKTKIKMDKMECALARMHYFELNTLHGFLIIHEIIHVYNKNFYNEEK